LYKKEDIMAHFHREVSQGQGIPDPRLRTYFIYKCNVCGSEQEHDWVPNFDSTRLRKCKNCGVLDDTNDQEYLIKRSHQIEQKLKELQDEMIRHQIELKVISEKLTLVKAPVLVGQEN
jgi:DNA-directed RNA polymerase subunit RPC12/RpoP